TVRSAIPKLERATRMDAPPFVTAVLGYAYGMAGDRTRALAMIDSLKKISPHGEVVPFNLAMIYLGLGDRARALDNFEKAYAGNSEFLFWLGVDHIFDPLRKEPRFVTLLQKLNVAK